MAPNGGSEQGYCIDTSAIGDLEAISESTKYNCSDEEREQIWVAIEGMAGDGRLVTVHAARDEFKRKCPQAFERLDPLTFFMQDTIPLWTELQNVFTHSPRWQHVSADRTRHTRDKADWYLVALARLEGRTLVTNELHRSERTPNNRNKDCIPDVCQRMGVRWLKLQEFIEEVGLK